MKEGILVDSLIHVLPEFGYILSKRFSYKEPKHEDTIRYLFYYIIMRALNANPLQIDLEYSHESISNLAIDTRFVLNNDVYAFEFKFHRLGGGSRFNRGDTDKLVGMFYDFYKLAMLPSIYSHKVLIHIFDDYMKRYMEKSCLKDINLSRDVYSEVCSVIREQNGSLFSKISKKLRCDLTNIRIRPVYEQRIAPEFSLKAYEVA